MNDICGYKIICKIPGSVNYAVECEGDLLIINNLGDSYILGRSGEVEKITYTADVEKK